MLYVLRVGCPWRDMCERYGKWNSVYVWFRCWAEQGIWDALLESLVEFGLADDWQHMIDSTTVRGHSQAAGANVWPAPVQAMIRVRCQDGDPRVLILIKGPASKAILQRPQPGSRRCVAPGKRGHRGSGTLDQHLAQIPASTLGDSQQFWLAASGGLTRYKAQPGGEISPHIKRRCAAHRCHKCGGIQRPYTGNACQPPGPIVGFGHACELSVKGRDPAVQLLPKSAHVPQQERHARAQRVHIGVQQLTQKETQSGMSLRHNMATLQQKASDLVGQRGSFTH